MANAIFVKSSHHNLIKGGLFMKFTCPECRNPIKLTVEEIQKRHCTITCPSCQKTIELKNNLPLPKEQKR